MKKTLFTMAIGCAACSIWFASAATAESLSEQQSDQSQNSYSTSSSGNERNSDSWKNRSIQGGNHLVRASRLTGADVSDSSGSRIGRIEDILINPASGRIDFAVLSLNAAGSASSPSGYNSGSSSSRYNSAPGQSSENSSSTMNSGGTADTANSSSASSSSSSGERLVPVPWSLLRASSSSDSSSSSSSSYTGQTRSFTLNIDRSKLDQAPTLSRGNWSDTSQSEWRSRVYTYYGVSESSAGAGAAESPSGVSQGQGAERLTGHQNSPGSSEQNP